MNLDFLKEKQTQLKKELNKAYLIEHNKYHLSLLQRKIRCYQLYPSNPIQYKQCFDYVENLTQHNYKMLKSSLLKLQNQLDNQVLHCSRQKNSQQDFKACVLSNFLIFRNNVNNLYSSCYKSVNSTQNVIKESKNNQQQQKK